MRYLSIIYWTLLCAGCSGTAKQPALHDFGLPVVSETREGGVNVDVNAPTWLWDNRIRYRLLYSSPSQIRFYGLDRWIASPPELFEQLVMSGGLSNKFTLRIRLQDFEQQFDAPDNARVILRFSVEAFSVDNKRKLGSKDFYLQHPTKTPDAAGAVNGIADLARLANKEIQVWAEGLADQ